MLHANDRAWVGGTDILARNDSGLSLSPCVGASSCVLTLIGHCQRAQTSQKLGREIIEGLDKVLALEEQGVIPKMTSSFFA